MSFLHSVQLLSGLASAALLLALSQPMANLFGVPGAAGSFAALALIPLFNSFAHLDVARSQRILNFWPVSLVEIIPQIVVTAAVWPITVWLKDYRSIIVVLCVKALLSTAVSHVMAVDRFRWTWDRQTLREVLAWSWPLALSGMVMFASQQASQMVIGGAFSVTQLASYAIAASLVSVPWFIFANVALALALPVLAQGRSIKGQFESKLRLFLSLSAVVGILLFLPLALCGEDLVRLIYGKSYTGCGIYMLILGAGLTFRILGTAGTLAAYARGDTRTELYANICRCVSLPLSLCAVWAGGNPVIVAGCVLVGEFAGVISSLIRLSSFISVPMKDYLQVSAFLGIFLVSAIILLSLGIQRASLGVQLGASISCAVLAIVLALAMFPNIQPMLATFRSTILRRKMPA